ncbi:DNA replication and repair protein RecN [Parasphingorhabdus marina DSM 22363]|uniref:DNA repair protein RecN n=1 Tax=Parasphingorhabdus marina DSM 22363 TaxID=1123272 RepID=A0A1N6ETQ5_9SPHN|nr:DNA repair protein RecN [Parasphingorhabdus marina]SIN86370.1 DNA replication and repair protein RecN [Parasphingorhabdus marina DSM 22363]
MLQSLSIRNIVLIEALDLEFGSGLSVLTGETGAGKSILLDSLGLTMGSRADSGLVRQGSEKAQVTAVFDAPPAGSKIARYLEENDIELEPGEPLIIKRSVKADGGSRAFVNDQPCSAALLRQAGSRLIEIHGQHDDRGLINPRGHRALLDMFAGANLAAVEKAHAAWQAAKQALETAREDQEAAEKDRDYLQHSVAELSKFAPQEGEEQELALERATMMKGEKLTGDLEAIRSTFDGSEGGLASLRAAARRLDRIAGDHPLLAEALAAIDRAVIEAGEAEDKLNEAASALTFDPQRLDDMETRLFELRALARKHRVEPDRLQAFLVELETRLAAISDGGQSLERLDACLQEARHEYIEAAEALRTKRVKAAKALDKAVAGELKPLKLDAARFETLVEELPEDNWNIKGMDRVEFLISTNPGAPLAPLGKIASGGELSRFILALKVALAEEGGAKSIIFDEVDRGVGGAVAAAIGERLARLSDGAQLLVVTHSPQVASRGDAHYLINKSSDSTVSRTDVQALDADNRRQEIARMLSGADVTDEARAQADRLLEGV